jgi:DNA modification methylase
MPKPATIQPMTATSQPTPPPPKPTEVTITRAKGRPMLSWVGKKPLGRVTAFPAQAVERFSAADAAQGQPLELQKTADWSKWPKALQEQGLQGGLLYHGDNKEVLAHLLANGFRGQVKLIYIDPPFDSGADYVRQVQLRGPKGTIKIDGEDYALGEQVQYTDIWSNDNYLQFMYERLLMLRELLSEDGALYLHCDWNKAHHLRCLLEEVFGVDGFRNEIIWQRVAARSDSTTYNHIHDVVMYCTKGPDSVWNQQYHAYSDKYVEDKYALVDEAGRKYQLDNLTSPNPRPNMTYEWMGHPPPEKGWRYSKETMQRLHDEGRIWYPEDKQKRPRLIRYLDEGKGVSLRSIWTDINPVNSQADERSEYPTQKPETLLERLIATSTNPASCSIASSARAPRPPWPRNSAAAGLAATSTRAPSRPRPSDCRA